MNLQFPRRGNVPTERAGPDPVAYPEPVVVHEPSPTNAGPEPDAVKPRRNTIGRIVMGLVVCFLFFYVLSDYTSFTAGQIHPGELIFSNTMIQLWTATYRLAFIFAVVLAMIGLVWQGLWQFFRPSKDRDFDLGTSIRNDLTNKERLWLFFIVFLSLCYLFVQLLMVRLPESVSVGP